MSNLGKAPLQFQESDLGGEGEEDSSGRWIHPSGASEEGWVLLKMGRHAGSAVLVPLLATQGRETQSGHTKVQQGKEPPGRCHNQEDGQHTASTGLSSTLPPLS